MRTRRAAARAVALAAVLALSPAARSGVIPIPADIVPGSGSFAVDSATVLRVPAGDRDAADAARYLSELWSRTNGLTLP
ncbi:MAG: hypothetical protein WBF89_06635, partial [Steroidobacteraceae bacterium]